MKSFSLLKIIFSAIGILTVLVNMLEFFWVRIFRKPIFIHLYFIKKKLSQKQRSFLSKNSPFYRQLSPSKKEYFEHRLICFIRNYKFVARDGFVITSEIKILVACSYLKLTFGMRSFLTTTFDKIIIYPAPFYSITTKQLHKGEFNPFAKAVVFSWSDFLSGNIDTEDNINLGIHEFTHALTFHGKKSNDVSARLFYSGFLEITRFMNQKESLAFIKNANYFRNYGLTNRFEFIAVVMEHFFETPENLKKVFPLLYEKMVVMVNYDPIKKN